jgi:ketosteroid isomerase-like protein
MATADGERNVERVRTGFEAFNRGDFEAVLAFFSDDVEIFSSPSLANPGTYHGHDGYREWLAQWLEVWEGFEPRIERIEPVGAHHVVAGVRQSARGRGSGIEVEMTLAYMLDLGEATTRAMHLYPTWDEAIAEAARREAGGPN